MRALGDVRVARRGSIAGTAWVGPGRLLALSVIPGCCGAGDTIVSGVDVNRRRVLWHRKLGGSLQAGERLRRGVVLVLGPRGRRVGPSRIVLVGPRGGVRSAPLPGIRSGSEPRGRVTHRWDPGLAVDRSSGRAFVVQAGAAVAEVDLESLAVTTHPLAATAADAIAGPTRHALWLGAGLLAVTGTDHAESGTQRAAGLSLVDTHRWTSRTISARATDAAVVAGTLLSSTFLEGRRSGSGLTGFSLSGTRRFHRFGSAAIWGVQRIGRNALVGAAGGSTLVRARTGRRLLHLDRFTASLLSGDPPLVPRRAESPCAAWWPRPRAPDSLPPPVDRRDGGGHDQVLLEVLGVVDVRQRRVRDVDARGTRRAAPSRPWGSRPAGARRARCR